jgi:hypothetical protein
VDGDGIELTTPKMKEGEPCKPKYFKLAKVTLNDWKDSDGYDVTSAVMVSSGFFTDYTTRNKTLNEKQAIVFKVLNDEIASQGISPPDCLKGFIHTDNKVILAQNLKEKLKGKIHGKNVSRDINSALEQLISMQKIQSQDGYYWPV